MSLETLTTITVLAVVVEFVTEIIKTTFPRRLKTISGRQIAAVTGIVICLTTQSGILKLFQIPISLPHIDYFITGLIISRGSNVIHDLFNQFEKSK